MSLSREDVKEENVTRSTKAGEEGEEGTTSTKAYILSLHGMIKIADMLVPHQQKG